MESDKEQNANAPDGALNGGEREPVAENQTARLEKDAAEILRDVPSTAQDADSIGSAPSDNAAETAHDGVPADSTPADTAAGMREIQKASLPKKRHRWVLNVLLIAVIGIGMYSLFSISSELSEDGGMSFSEALDSIELSGVAILLAVVAGIIIIDSLKFCITNKAVIGRVRPGVAIKTSFLGKFYDGVTPFSTGGQPMQIYYMTTKGVSGANSSAIVLIRYFGSIFAFTFIGAVFMILGVSLSYIDNVGIGKTLLLVCGWVGLAVNLILPVFISFFVFMPKLAHRLTGFVIAAGIKLHIVKNKYRVMKKMLKTVDNFTKSFKLIVKRPICLVLFLICCFAENFLTFSVPYFVMNALSCDVGGMFFEIMTLNVFATFGVSFIPTPGNSGVVEGMGALAFNVAAGAALSWSVLFWRFSVYYIYIIIGIIITIADLIIKNIQSKKLVKDDKIGHSRN